mgnify:CR=1 FL=1
MYGGRDAGSAPTWVIRASCGLRIGSGVFYGAVRFDAVWEEAASRMQPPLRAQEGSTGPSGGD